MGQQQLHHSDSVIHGYAFPLSAALIHSCFANKGSKGVRQINFSKSTTSKQRSLVNDSTWHVNYEPVC